MKAKSTVRRDVVHVITYCPVFSPRVSVQVCPASSASRCLSAYKNNRLNGDNQDLDENTFPDGGFSLLKIKLSDWQGSSKRPDSNGRYWWDITLEDGSHVKCFCWVKDEARGWPDKSNKGRYWFKVLGSNGLEIPGFSWEPEHGRFPDPADGYYYRFVQYTECGSIKEWMQQRDSRYLANLSLSNIHQAIGQDTPTLESLLHSCFKFDHNASLIDALCAKNNFELLQLGLAYNQYCLLKSFVEQDSADANPSSSSSSSSGFFNHSQSQANNSLPDSLIKFPENILQDENNNISATAKSFIRQNAHYFRPSKIIHTLLDSKLLGTEILAIAVWTACTPDELEVVHFKFLQQLRQTLESQEVELCARIAAYCNISVLDCSGVELQDNQIEEVISCMRFFPKLSELNLAGNKLTNDSTMKLEHELPRHPHLSFINLANNGITDGGIDYLLEGWRQSNKKLTIDVSNNYLSFNKDYIHSFRQKFSGIYAEVKITGNYFEPDAEFALHDNKIIFETSNIIDGSKPNFHSLLQNEFVSRDNWIVYLLRNASKSSKNSEHALLMLEGVYKFGQRFIEVYDFTDDAKVNKKPWNSQTLAENAAKYKYWAYQITRAQGDKLKAEIEKNKNSYKYSSTGCRPSFASSPSSPDVEYHNCYTWAIKQLSLAGILKENARPSVALPTSWYIYGRDFVPIPKEEILPEPSFQEQSWCSIS